MIPSVDTENQDDENSVENGYSERLSCSKSTKDVIIKDCIHEFKKHHPELNGVYVTNNMILIQIAKFYLKS